MKLGIIFLGFPFVICSLAYSLQSMKDAIILWKIIFCTGIAISLEAIYRCYMYTTLFLELKDELYFYFFIYHVIALLLFLIRDTCKNLINTILLCMLTWPAIYIIAQYSFYAAELQLIYGNFISFIPLLNLMEIDAHQDCRYVKKYIFLCIFLIEIAGLCVWILNPHTGYKSGMQSYFFSGDLSSLATKFSFPPKLKHIQYELDVTHQILADSKINGSRFREDAYILSKAVAIVVRKGAVFLKYDLSSGVLCNLGVNFIGWERDYQENLFIIKRGFINPEFRKCISDSDINSKPYDGMDDVCYQFLFKLQ